MRGDCCFVQQVFLLLGTLATHFADFQVHTEGGVSGSVKVDAGFALSDLFGVAARRFWSAASNNWLGHSLVLFWYFYLILLSS